MEQQKIAIVKEVSLLKEAAREIEQLRNQNRIMSARLDMFDNIQVMLRTDYQSGRSMGMVPDIVWEINRHLENMAGELATEKHPN